MEPVQAETLMEPPYDGNVSNLLLRAVEAHPEKTAVDEPGMSLTFAEFGQRVKRLAGGLRGMGLGEGDRVGVYVPNGVGFCEAVWACLFAGTVMTPLNPAYRRRELTYQLDHADAEAVLVHPDTAEYAVPVAEDRGIDVVCTGEHETLTTTADLRDQGDPTNAERSDGDIALQPYTSGTTGEPKGVLLTHRNSRVQLVNYVAGYTASPVQGDNLMIRPMYHIAGLNQMMGSLCAGRTVHTLRSDRWDPELVLEKIEEHQVPGFTGVSTMFIDLLEAYDPNEHDISSVESVNQGGAKLPEPVHEQVEEVFGVEITEGYGLTEVTSGSHSIVSSTLGDKIGSIGQPLGHVDAKIVDPETGDQVPIGEEGELLLRGPNVMKGYYKNEAANEEAFTDLGYFRTGDIASRDEDNYYYIKGREKEMILAGGYNVYPAEVEATLYDHPQIREAAVFGVPDERKGETVAAAVSLTEEGDLTPAEIQGYVLDELAPYKHPRYVEIRETLPKTGSGKIRKTDIQDDFDASKTEAND